MNGRLSSQIVAHAATTVGGRRGPGALRFTLASLLAAALVVAGCSDGDPGPAGPAGAQGPPGPQGPAGATPPGVDPLEPGLILTIKSVTIGADLKPVVSFQLTDGAGNPVDFDALDGDPRFGLAHLVVDSASQLTKYQSYVTRTVDGQQYEVNGTTMDPVLASAEQATTDSGGEFAAVDDIGNFTYTFATAVPAGYERTATHLAAGYVTRQGRTYVANDAFTFVPDGSAPSVTREVVKTEVCNDCHNPLAIHGGARREVGLCLVCHTDQSIDPETGNSVEMGLMTHKIHYGASLAEPYVVVGFRQSVHDYGEAIFPQDVRNCDTCHRDGTDSDNWKTSPSRQACGSCHDEVNFASGANHGGIIQTTDQFCTQCHPSDLREEFDKSVPGAHVMPSTSVLNPHLTLAITDVTNMKADQTPTIRFTVTDKDGPVEAAGLNRVRVTFGGPTTDYTHLISETELITIIGSGADGTLTVNGPGDFSYTPATYKLPADASGTWVVAMEGRTESIDVGPDSVRYSSNNPIANVDVADGTLGGGSPVARREVVDDALCLKCHKELSFHGGAKTELDYCLVCHAPWSTDEGERVGVDPVTNPPESIDFKYLVHRIHFGMNQTVPYVVYGHNNSVHDYSHVVYPGDIADCTQCHKDDTHLLPVPQTNAATVLNIAGVTVPQPDAIRTPTTTACTGCHDDADALTHSQLNSIVASETEWSESCNVCHGEGSSVAVGDVHGL